MQFDDTQGARIAEHYACILFDKKTGKIAHIHESITFAGAKSPSRDDVEARAVLLAREFAAKLPGVKLDRLQALHVRPEDLKEGQSLKVDTKSRKLVQIAPKRASAGRSKKRRQSRRPKKRV
jgi:hypothetical protein